MFLRSGAMAMFSVGLAPSFLARAADAAGAGPSRGRRRLLIAIFQRGAVDGLNMVVPYGEAEYYRLRPSIAIPRAGADGALDLDGFFGLHPGMAALKPLWENHSLAVVHATGSPDATRSHFDAQDYMESGTPGVKSTRDGWLNRVLQTGKVERNPLRGVAVTRQMPRSLQGLAPSLAVAALDEFRVRGATPPGSSVETLFEADTMLGGTAAEAFDAMRALHAATARPYRPAGGASYPRSRFGRALQEIARVAKADVGLEVAFAECRDWDHHVNEGGVAGRLAARLTDLSNGIAALAADLGDRMADTVVLTMSEFGRTVAENGTGGTDHGHGNAMLIAGGHVKGGRVYGRWPGLGADQRFEGRDLAVTTDFRDVFGEIVTKHLAAPTDALAQVFPGHLAGRALGIL
jgi:uncharacterized protein (DUF1501 family)